MYTIPMKSFTTDVPRWRAIAISIELFPGHAWVHNEVLRFDPQGLVITGWWSSLVRHDNPAGVSVYDEVDDEDDAQDATSNEQIFFPELLPLPIDPII
jgi:hypothetical protein